MQAWLIRTTFTIRQIFGLMINLGTRGYSEISHGGGAGYAKAESSAGNIHQYFLCLPPGSLRPPYFIRLEYELMKYLDGYWGICWYNGGWIYNGTDAETVSDYQDFGNDSPPCSDGYYATYAHAEVKWDGTWRGGWLWSGRSGDDSHYLPSP